MAPIIRGVCGALPPHRIDQAQSAAAISRIWADVPEVRDRIEDLHRSTRVSTRHLAMPISDYGRIRSFRERNEIYTRVALEVGEVASRQALTRAGVAPGELGHIFLVSTTGIATPSLEARLANRLGIATLARRSPIFGLGCAGGAAGLARAADWLRAYPSEVALLVSVELCSLTFQADDHTMANCVAAALFGDAAAAVVLAGAARGGAGPRVRASRSVLYPDTERMMGWDLVDSGFQLVLSPRIPELVRTHLRADVDAFLASEGLDRRRVAHFIAHSGGPKVLDAIQDALELPPEALRSSWEVLGRMGNASSPTVLFVLGDLIGTGQARPGDLGLLFALGPGFSAEMVLVEW
jgi:alkylresorcinol/alkylpyrone synthase